MNRILTITGPTCSGKSTLAKALTATGKFLPLIGFTTRSPRQGEIEGVDYYFLTKEQAQDYINKGLTADGVEFKGNTYGILVKEINRVRSLGKTPTAILEPQGLAQFYNKYPTEVYSTFLGSELQVLLRRYLERVVTKDGTSLEYHTQRLLGLLEEHKHWEYDYYDKKFPLCDENTLPKIVDLLVQELC